MTIERQQRTGNKVLDPPNPASIPRLEGAIDFATHAGLPGPPFLLWRYVPTPSRAKSHNKVGSIRSATPGRAEPPPMCDPRPWPRKVGCCKPRGRAWLWAAARDFLPRPRSQSVTRAAVVRSIFNQIPIFTAPTSRRDPSMLGWAAGRGDCRWGTVRFHVVVQPAVGGGEVWPRFGTLRKRRYRAQRFRLYS